MRCNVDHAIVFGMPKQFIVIEGYTTGGNEVMPIDTPQQVHSARAAIAEAGLARVPVWFGDMDAPDSYKSATIFLNAAEVMDRDRKPCKITTRRSDNGSGYDYTITDESARLVAEGWVEGTRMAAVREACLQAEALGYEVPR